MTVALTEYWVLAEVLAYEVENRKAMRKGTEHAVGVLNFLCAFLACWGVGHIAFRPFQLQLSNEIVVTLVIFAAGVTDHIVTLGIGQL